MAMVPLARGPQVQRRPTDTTPLQAVDMTSGTRGLGGALEQVGQTGQRVVAEQDRIDQTLDEAAAKQADAQLQEFHRNLLYTGDNAFYSKQGQNALNARADVEKQLKDKQTELLGGLTSPRQQFMFNQVSQARTNEALTGVGRYAAGQTQVYERQQSQARVYQSTQDAILHADNPEQLQTAIGTIRSETLSQAQRDGLQGDAGTVLAGKAVSDAYASVVEGKAASDPLTAQRFYDLHKDQIEPATQIRIDKMLQAPIDQQFADEQSDAIRGMGAADPNPSAAALISAVTGQESAGRNGLRSSAGALGVMQVLPGTAKDVCKTLGIPYDENRLRNDPAYCTRIGTAYLQQLMTKYGGNSTLALAAYNAGAKRVDDWLDNIGDPRKGEMTNAQWAARIPIKETRDYVPGVLRRLGSAAPKNAPQENDLNAQLAHADQLAATVGWTPDQVKGVKEQLIQKAGLDQRLLVQGQKQAEDQAWNIVMPVNGGAVTDPNKVPPALWSKMSPEGQRSIRAQIKANAKGEDIPPNPDLYYKLSTVAANNPQAFAQLDLRPYASQLPKGDWEQMNTLQRAAVADGAKSPKVAGFSRIWSLSKDAFQDAGFGVGAKASTSDRAAQVKFMNQMVAQADAWQQAHGKPPSDDDLIGLRDKLLMNVDVVTPGRLWGENRTSTPFFQAQGQPHVQVPIPNTIKQRIITSYQRTHGGANPSDQDISDMYVRHKGDLW
jgi:soluble lytic murein transglycosylase